MTTDNAKRFPGVEWQPFNRGARLRSMWCNAFDDGHWTISNADGTERLAEGDARGGLAGAERAIKSRLTWPGDAVTLAAVVEVVDGLRATRKASDNPGDVDPWIERLLALFPERRTRKAKR